MLGVGLVFIWVEEFILLGVCLEGRCRRLRWRMTLAAATALAALVGAGWFPVSSARAATLTVNTSSLAARQASAYSATLRAAGGTAPYHWSVSGSLPVGLSLSTAGVITGVPTAAGTTNVTLKVTDSATPTPASATRTLPLTVLARLNQSIVYVLSDQDSAVTEYAPGASGDAAPTAEIYGPNTGMGFIIGLAVSPARRVYVAGFTQNSAGAVFEFAPGASGNVAPQTVISGSATGLNSDGGVALDRTGDIWVANGGNSTITEYGPSASGNVAPRLTLGGPATGLGGPVRLTFDAAGNVWVSNSQNSTVTEYAAASLRQTSSQPVNLAPIATLASTDVQTPAGIAFDPLGGLHVDDPAGGAVVGFSPGSPNGNPAPAENIVGGNTQLLGPVGLAPDPAGRLYVAAAGIVSEFNYNSNGNASPVAAIGGPATQLAGAIDVAVSGPAPVAYAGASTLRPAVGARYSYKLTARGGIAPYRFAVSSGTLPAGLSLASSGVISGVPRSAGTSTVTIRITDSAMPAASTTKTLQLIVGAPPPLRVSTTALPPTAVGQYYAATLAATGGVGPYAWAISAGALPSRLALSSDGKITGTPSFSGAFRFTVTVTDSATPTSHTASRTLTLAVKVQPGVYVANGGNDSVTEYPLGLGGGDIPPIADITGPHTGLSSPESVVLDAAGDVFVANEGNNTVTEYAPGATGDVSPVMTISGVSQPARLALNGSGDLYVASLANSISEYSVGSGASNLIATITGQDQPRGLAVDANGDLWVSESLDNAIKEYSPTASGAATPIASIFGADTGLTSPQGLVFDSSGNLTVANAGTNGSDATVTVYSAGQLSGDSVPAQTLSSGLAEPLGVDRGTDQTLFVADVGDNAVVDYAPGATTPSDVISGPIFTHLSVPVGVAATPPLSILTASLPAAHRHRRYLVNLKAAEGTTPYTWTVSRGRLPRGLSLTRKGAIIGTPRSRTGVYRFTVRVRDRTHPAQVVTQKLRLRLKRHARGRGVRAGHHRHR